MPSHEKPGDSLEITVVVFDWFIHHGKWAVENYRNLWGAV